jgi:hypothetical protein
MGEQWPKMRPAGSPRRVFLANATARPAHGFRARITRECPLLADFVAEVGHFGCEVPASVFFETSSYCAPLGSGDHLPTLLASRIGYARHASTAGGGRAISLASRRRFWAIAASVNSNWEPCGPRSRRRPSLRMRLRWANSISMRFLSRHDCSNALVLASARATSRDSS